MGDGLPRYTDELYMTVPAAARLVQVSDQTIYNRLKDGRLRGLDRDDERNPTGEYQVYATDACLMHVDRHAPEQADDDLDPIVMEHQMLQADLRSRLEEIIATKDQVIAAQSAAMSSKDAQIESLKSELRAALSAQEAATRARLADLA